MARAAPGSESSSWRLSSFGRVNGWCTAFQRFSSSSHSSSGKSVTQRKRQASRSISPSSRPRWRRSAPSTRATIALLVVDEIREALRAPLLGDPFEPFEVGARELLGNAQETDGRRVREDAELGAARQLRHFLDLEPEAQVRLVRSIARLRLVPGHPLERALDLDVEAVAPDGSHRLLHQREDELLVGEGHLDVELRELLQAVGAEILVAEAARDLVVALEAGDDEQLLVDLRRLGQREEATRLQPRRDEEVTGPLGRRLAHDRRLDVDEAGRFHLCADR